MPSTIPSSELVVMLASSLGREQAERAVSEAVSTLRLQQGRLSQGDCDRLLDKLGLTPGLVGVVARFAKARIPFMFTTSAPEEPRRLSNPRMKSIGLSMPLEQPGSSPAPRPRFDRRDSGSLVSTDRRTSGRWRTASASPSSGEKKVGLGRIVEFFADGMDHLEADRIVRAAVDAAHLESRQSFTRSEVNQILDLVAERGPSHRTNALLVRARLTSEYR